MRCLKIGIESQLLCGGFPVCQRYTRRQKSLLYSFPLSPSSSGQGRHPFKVDIAGSNPAGGTTAFEQVKACFSSWPVFVSAHVRQARAPNVRQISRKPPSDSPRGQRGGPPPARGAAPPRAFQLPRSAPRLPFCLPVCLAFCSPLGCPRALVPRLPLGYPSARAFARPLGCPLAHRRGPPRPRLDRPKRKADRPHGSARPSALDIPLCARPFATRSLGLLLARLLGPLPVRPPAFARPLATLGNPSGARPSVTPLLPLGARLCPPARLPHRRGPPRTRADHPAKAKGKPLPPRNGPPFGARYAFVR